MDSGSTLRGKLRLLTVGGCQLTTLFEAGSKFFGQRDLSGSSPWLPNRIRNQRYSAHCLISLFSYELFHTFLSVHRLFLEVLHISRLITSPFILLLCRISHVPSFWKPNALISALRACAEQPSDMPESPRRGLLLPCLQAGVLFKQKPTLQPPSSPDSTWSLGLQFSSVVCLIWGAFS